HVSTFNTQDRFYTVKPPRPPISTLLPYTTLFRSFVEYGHDDGDRWPGHRHFPRSRRGRTPSSYCTPRKHPNLLPTDRVLAPTLSPEPVTVCFHSVSIRMNTFPCGCITPEVEDNTPMDDIPHPSVDRVTT